MGIAEKIEAIRRKPEHIRMVYVWAMVAISMLFVLTIWFFSFKSEIGQVQMDGSANSGMDIVNELNQQIKN